MQRARVTRQRKLFRNDFSGTIDAVAVAMLGTGYNQIEYKAPFSHTLYGIALPSSSTKC